MITNLGKIYAGRASSAPISDLFITLMSMGLNGYKDLLEQRGTLVTKFQERFSKIAQSQGERMLQCPKNTISFGITLDRLAIEGDSEKKKAEVFGFPTAHKVDGIHMRGEKGKDFLTETIEEAVRFAGLADSDSRMGRDMRNKICILYYW